MKAILFFLLFHCQDTVQPDYRKIYGAALDGDVRSALTFLPSDTSAFVRDFTDRFGYASDRSVEGLLSIYKEYWRESLLDPSGNYDSALIRQLGHFLGGESIDSLLQQYIHAHHLYTTGFGKTGRLYDLLVWGKQTDTVYSFVLAGDTTRAPVCFMEDFVTLGWEQYATLGRHYPGGWATPTTLFCVKAAYDLNSEDFTVSYLAHESRHFRDYKLFPDLKSADLEYRAKLTELSLANTSLYHLIDFFASNAHENSETGHAAADYRVIHDLSMALFHRPFEARLEQWKKLDPSAIHHAAATILRENTLFLGRRAAGHAG